MSSIKYTEMDHVKDHEKFEKLSEEFKSFSEATLREMWASALLFKSQDTLNKSIVDFMHSTAGIIKSLNKQIKWLSICFCVLSFGCLLHIATHLLS